MSLLNEKVRIADWILDPRAQTLVCGDVQHRLNAKMVELLRCLYEQPGRTVTREELINDVWNGNRFVGQRGLTNVVWQLRQCLGADAISTVAKVGYRLDLPVEIVAANDDDGARARHSRTATSLLLLSAVVTVSVGAWHLYESVSPELAPRYTQTSLTYFNGVEEYPAFSTAGDFLAFTWEQANLGSRLFIRDLRDESAPLRQLSMGAEDEVAPAWGIGDRELAFARIGKDGSCTVVVRSLLSMAERDIDNCAYERYHRILDWSRDGRFLFYSRSGPERGVISIYRHEIATGETRRVSSPHAGQEDKQLAVAPDGQLAFIRSVGATADVFVVAPDGSTRQVTHTHEPIYGLAWRDNRRLVINLLRDGRFALWQLDTVSGKTEFLHRAETPFNIAVPPHDDSMLAFSLHRGVEYLQVWNLVAQKLESEITSTGRDMYGRISPDGKRVIFLSTRSGDFEIWSANRDGSNPQQLTRSTGMPELPVWSPDGTQLAVPIFDNQGRYQVALFDMASGKSRQLTEGEYDYRNLNWFGDENALLVSSDRGGDRDLWRLSLEDGSAQRLTDDSGVYGQVSGEYLYYTRAAETGIWRRPLAGGATELVTADLHRDDWGSWQMTDKGLYYVAREPDADEVRLHDPGSGAVTTIASLEKNSIRIYRSLHVNEAANRLVLTRLGNRQADIVLLTPTK